ncbi:DUF2971 domain-containing protein [Photobacterium sp. GB-72]|uniref:DUF2971 domain-containing protein n=1 Tax=Photobacterium sp. GB-72 TaxID=2022105 RepID=UPI000D16F5B9|nr:DUF2971 domain-containing protein [Photobacterium sp. GB-72]PSV29284.1 hypothetical protein C9J40_18030 [Photobacterium sp. GB-72]
MLYKYFSFNENSLSCLINNEIWASKPTEFNDPFDSILTIDFENKKINSLFNEYVEHKAISCFSKNMDNILMWSHYADCHRGFCIGIDCLELENSKIMVEVKYSESFLEVDNDTFLHSNKIGGINEEWQRILTQKYDDWKYEEEVRLILQLNDSNAKGKLFCLPDGAIKEIYFGCNMNEKNKNTIRKILKNDQVIFYDMKKSKNNFKLDII